jgi:urease accessory protein
VAFAAIAPGAFAHHMEDGEMPKNWISGLMSGMGHPVIGFDHLLFIIGVGLAAAAVSRPITLPLAFIAATALGVIAHVMHVDVALVDLMVLASVVSVGALLAFRPDAPYQVWLALFIGAGFFHGYAYGEAIVGSEPAPLAAYLIGLSAIQLFVAVTVAIVGGRVLKLGRSGIRIGGGALAGAGLAFASLLLPAIGPG